MIEQKSLLPYDFIQHGTIWYNFQMIDLMIINMCFKSDLSS